MVRVDAQRLPHLVQVVLDGHVLRVLDPEQQALTVVHDLAQRRQEISREIAAVRAIQSLSVLDVRSYAKLVFDLGDYAGQGEDREIASRLP